MNEPTKKLNWNEFEYGDIVRCTRGVRGSKGKKYKFTGAVFGPDDDKTPLYIDLIEIGRGQFKTVKPEFVVKDVASSKAAQARLAKKEAAKEDAAQARQERKAAK